MSYNSHINTLGELSVFDIIRISREMLQPQHRNRPWELVNHGVNLLENEEQLYAYIAAYGEMHWAKCRAAFQNFPFDELHSNFEVVDWGCGQGIATVSLVEMLRERDKLNLLRKVTLIEPSEAALGRAFANVDKATNHNITILTHQKYLPYNSAEQEITGIEYEYPITIHLFSNILDIASIDLEKLARIVGTSGPQHYVMCMGPKNSGAYRIDQFCSIFNTEEWISNIDNGRYGFTSDTNHSYSCKTKCLLFNNGTLTTHNVGHYVAPTLIGNTPIYDDYDPRILQFNNITTEHIEAINTLFGKILNQQDIIYIKPNINGDTPDLAVLRPKMGILLINVYEGSPDKAADLLKAARRVQTYQHNMVQLHLKDMMGQVLLRPANWSVIKTMLYVPSLSTAEARKLCKDYKYVNIFGFDIFDYQKNKLLEELKFTYAHEGFSRIVQNSFINIVSPRWHSYKQGKHVVLTKAQKPLAKSEANARRKINGVAGSGKTQVLATRAINACLRTGKPVLILTYNITLVNYIRHRIGEVRADFSWDKIHINNYHQFFNTVANNLHERVYLGVYEDERFFEPYSNYIPKYAAIFIDEVQDYRTQWLRILHDNFLEQNGEFVVFGDAKQNIYKRELDNNGQIRLDMIRAGWNNSLTRSMRFANTQLANMAMAFQQRFFPEQQGDTIEVEQSLAFDTCIKYWYINPQSDMQTITANCRWIMREHNLAAEDVVILSQYCDTLRELDYTYRGQTQLGASTTYETREQYDELKRKHGVTEENIKAHSGFICDLKQLRRNKRLHFTMDTSLVKMSTIHSYKGWEAKAVILVLMPPRGNATTFDECFDKLQNEQSLIYTAITRAKEKLFILNVGNVEYHPFFSSYK